MFTSDDVICINLTLKRGVVQRLKWNEEKIN